MSCPLRLAMYDGPDVAFFISFDPFEIFQFRHIFVHFAHCLLFSVFCFPVSHRFFSFSCVFFFVGAIVSHYVRERILI